MKKQKFVSDIEVGVNRRFFQVIEVLVSMRTIRSLSGFCDEVGLSAPRYREMRQEYGVAPTPGRVSRYTSINVEALCSVVSDYGVSGDWILTGRGKMFK